jgi:hypothetical protein
VDARKIDVEETVAVWSWTTNAAAPTAIVENHMKY